MRYLVDLEKKEIVYDKKVPAGHIIALKKIFEKQEYSFRETEDLKTIIDLEAELSAAMKSMNSGQYSTGPILYGSPGGYTHTSGSGHPVTESYRMDIMDFSGEKGPEIKDPPKHQNVEFPITPDESYKPEYYSPDGTKHDSKREMESWMNTRTYKSRLKTKNFEYGFGNAKDHPADKSKDGELKAEANKIKTEVEQAKKAFSLREELNALKAKLYSIL